MKHWEYNERFSHVHKVYMIKNMCIGFEIEGINHDFRWYKNQPKIGLHYFVTKSILDKKK